MLKKKIVESSCVIDMDIFTWYQNKSYCSTKYLTAKIEPKICLEKQFVPTIVLDLRNYDMGLFF